MGTHKLTPHHPHPVTGFFNAVIGWRFSAQTIIDVFTGIVVIERAGWTWDIHPDPNQPGPGRLQRMTITPARPAANVVPIIVHNNDWFVLDSDTISVLEADDVLDNYTVEPIDLPPPPPEPEPAPPPAPEPAPEPIPEPPLGEHTGVDGETHAGPGPMGCVICAELESQSPT